MSVSAYESGLRLHQISVAPSLQAKLTFAGPDATKWTYNVMPFGPINGPTTFIAFIHDVDATWKDLTRSCGLTIDEDLNTNVIVDDILSWAPTLRKALLYLFIGEFAIFRVLTHLVPYLKIQRILVNKLTSMTPKSKNTCRKLRVSAFKRY